MNAVVSKSTKQFQSFLDEQRAILAQKKRERMMSIYEEIYLKKRDHPILSRFYELIHNDIESIEIMTLVHKLLHSSS